MRGLARRLYFWVLVGIVTGSVLGIAAPATAVTLKPLSDGFINLVKMLIGPIVFLTVVLGFAGAGDIRKVGRVGVKTLVYFEVVSTLALDHRADRREYDEARRRVQRGSRNARCLGGRDLYERRCDTDSHPVHPAHHPAHVRGRLLGLRRHAAGPADSDPLWIRVEPHRGAGRRGPPLPGTGVAISFSG